MCRVVVPVGSLILFLECELHYSYISRVNTLPIGQSGVTQSVGQADRWSLNWDGCLHEVEIREVGLHRQIVWRVDGEAVAESKSYDERAILVTDGHGSLGLHFRTFAGTRRVTWFEHTNVPAALAANKTLVGGVDFEPEPGSKAARRRDWMHRHPRLYAGRQIILAAVAIAVGVLVTWLLGHLWPLIPWDWVPQIELPRIPWPDIPWPSIPWPDLPDINLPDWLGAVLDAAKFVAPVVLAGWLAVRESRRRRGSKRR